MGIFDVFKHKEVNVEQNISVDIRKNEKEEEKEVIPNIEDIHDSVVEVLNNILVEAKKYVVDGKFILTHSKEALDILYIDSARFQLERIILSYGLKLEEFYGYDYKSKNEDEDNDKNFGYVFNAYIKLFNNYFEYMKSLTSVVEVTKFNEGMKKSLDYLILAKEIISDEDSVKKYISSINDSNEFVEEKPASIDKVEDEQDELEEKAKETFESEIQLNTRDERLIIGIVSNYTSIFNKIKEMSWFLDRRDFEGAYNVLDNLYNEKDAIIDKANEISETYSEDSLATMYLGFIKAECKFIVYKFDILRINIDQMKVDLNLGNELNYNNFNNTAKDIYKTCDEFTNHIETLAKHLSKK